MVVSKLVSFALLAGVLISLLCALSYLFNTRIPTLSAGVPLATPTKFSEDAPPPARPVLTPAPIATSIGFQGGDPTDAVPNLSPKVPASLTEAPGAPATKAPRAPISMVVPGRATTGHLADGCGQVYLDVGSNRGVQVRKLFEPLKYKDGTVLPIFDQHFGPAHHRTAPFSVSGLCAFGFEASPLLREELEKLENTYVALDWRVKFFVPYAVSNSDTETLTLNLNAKHNLGASTVWKNEKRSYREPVTIPSLYLARFLEEEVWPRTTGTHSKKAVLMKMDIEGSEYLILPEMLKRGFLCRGLIDLIFIEWHDTYVENGHTRRLWIEKNLKKGTWCQGRPPSVVLDMDDETYAHSNKPLPKQGENVLVPPPPKK